MPGAVDKYSYSGPTNSRAQVTMVWPGQKTVIDSDSRSKVSAFKNKTKVLTCQIVPCSHGQMTDC